MSNGVSETRPLAVRRMFGRIARRYDRMNRLMTFGQDVHWRREVIRGARLQPTKRLLDIGAGTGDLALEALHQCPQARVVAVDFSPEMIRLGRSRRGGGAIHWIQADALRLPFPTGVFDACVSAFLLRNVEDLDRAIAEQQRVLMQQGRLLCLESAPPSAGFLRPFHRFFLHRWIPLLGRWVARNAAAYNYLPTTTETFLTGEALAERFRAAGLIQTGFVRRLLGAVSIAWGTKSAARQTKEGPVE